MPLVPLTIPGIGFKERTNSGHKSTEFTFFASSLLKGKILSKDHN